MQINKYLHVVIICALAFIFTAGEIFSSGKRQPVKLGFAGGLTGTLSDLGVAGRNGVILAVEEVNKKDGINGRQVALITKDDRNDPEIARKVDRELIDEGVVAIIGHMLSTMTMAAVPLTNAEKIVLISPTASTDDLTGIDDYFFRTRLPTRSETDHICEYLTEKIGSKRVVAIYDISNKVFTEQVYLNFKESYERMGGKIVGAEHFTSGAPESFYIMVKQLLSNTPDCVFIITGALDAALICQQVRKINTDITIVSSSWGMTPDLIMNGGPAVEGIIFSQPRNIQKQSEDYALFERKYISRFGSEPSFAAISGYDAARVIIDALRIDDSPDNLKSTILNHNVYKGIQGDLEIDGFGDAVGKRGIYTVDEGKFVMSEGT
jgi:branched-chain amino acid transport system substrate-binding protein